MPNMSRSRIRGGAPLTSASSSLMSISDLQSVSQINLQSNNLDNLSDSRHTLHQMSSSHRHVRSADQSDDGSVSDQLSLAPSSTRSGLRSTRSKKSSSRREMEMSDMSIDEYRQIEKQMEYSGTSGPYKEASKLSLFGLDQAEDMITDMDTASKKIKSSKCTGIFSVVTSYFWSIIITVFTIISVFYDYCWQLGVWLHGITARVLLLDVWILSSYWRRGAWCCLLLPLLLLLLPFLVGSVLRVITIVPVENNVPVTPVEKFVQSASASAGLSAATVRQIIAEELFAVKADLKSHGDQLTGNMAYIERLEKQLESQALLLAGLKDCCKNDTVLAALVRNDVQQQLAAILYGSDSGSSDGSSSAGGKSEQFSNAAFVKWLNSHFSGPSDPNFDAKITELTAMLNQGLHEQAEANKAALLAAKEAEQAALLAGEISSDLSGIVAGYKESQDALAALWADDKSRLDGVLAGLAADIKSTDSHVQSANLAALAAAAASEQASIQATEASNSANNAATLAAAAMATAKETSASIAMGTNTQCGCDSQSAMVGGFQGLSEEQVKLMIREALMLFDADKTGMVDYALESAGGSVISTRCSETYYRRTAQLSLFGFPLWYPNNSPRSVIQPEMQPGQCWPFKGTHGYIVIQLAGWVKITAFSMEHIPKSLSPTGQIDSAPKDFTVWGLKYERDTDGLLLGNYTYLDNEPLQFFPVRDPDVEPFHIVELRVNSNHGNPNYTCLYRFRVHGVLKKT